MLFCVNGLTAYWFMIGLLAIVRQIKEIIRKLNQIRTEVDSHDPTFDLDCGGRQLLEDTLANDDVQLQAPIRSDKFTQVGFPGSRSRKTTWTHPTFHAQNVPAASFGCLPPPMPERYLGPATYPTSSPETVPSAPFGCLPPPLPVRYLGPAMYPTSSPETVPSAPFGCLPPPLPVRYLGPAMYPTSSPETVPSAPFGCLPPPLPVRYLGPAMYPTSSLETVPAAPFGCLPPPLPERYLGPAMYVWWQPQPPSPATVAAEAAVDIRKEQRARFPDSSSGTWPDPSTVPAAAAIESPPKPEFYVGPAWFDVNGLPPLPCCVAASMFTYPPPPVRR